MTDPDEGRTDRYPVTRRRTLEALGAAALAVGSGASVTTLAGAQEEGDMELVVVSEQFFPGARDVRTPHDNQHDSEFAFVAGGESGLTHIVDVSPPWDLQVVATLDPPGGETDDVKAEGDLMQVNNDGGVETEEAPGMHYYDISDPRNPQPQGTFMDLDVAPSGFHDTHLHEGITYASDNTGGGSLHIIDPSDPTDPQWLGQWRVEEDAPREFQDDAGPGDYPHSQYGIGDHLYLAYQEAGCRVLDVSVPEDPVEIARFGMDADLHTHDVRVDENEEVCVLGGEVYCGEDLDADVNEGYHIWDISNLEDPQQLSTIEPVSGLECKWDGEPNATSHNVDIHNNRLYTNEYEGGVRVFDISDPSAPVELAHFNVENDDLTQNPPGTEPNEFEMWDTARWNRGHLLSVQRSPPDRLVVFRLRGAEDGGPPNGTVTPNGTATPNVTATPNETAAPNETATATESPTGNETATATETATETETTNETET